MKASKINMNILGLSKLKMKLPFAEKGKDLEKICWGEGLWLEKTRVLALDILFEITTRNQSKINNKLFELLIQVGEFKIYTSSPIFV